MTDFHLYHFIWLAVTGFGVWLLPIRYQPDGVAMSTGVFFTITSPISALLLLASSIVVYGLASSKKWPPHQTLLAGCLYCALQFLLIRGSHQFNFDILSQIPLAIGLGYYTCRHIHYLIEVYKGNIIPDFRQYLRYQFFLPVLLVGPIHRFANFQRQCVRRRFDPEQVSQALERILYGYFKIIVLGNYLVANEIKGWINEIHLNSLIGLWINSTMDWLYLYIQFSGWTDVAIGFALLMGFRIEENFNKPFLARNLVDFWQRWHITLSFWCRDYVFKPLVAVTRRPLLAIGAAMVTMGIWHELSLYYFFWGVYHAVGIAIARGFQHYSGKIYFLKQFTSHRVWTPVAWFLTVNYIILGSPVIQSVSKWFEAHI